MIEYQSLRLWGMARTAIEWEGGASEDLTVLPPEQLRPLLLTIKFNLLAQRFRKINHFPVLRISRSLVEISIMEGCRSLPPGPWCQAFAMAI